MGVDQVVSISGALLAIVAGIAAVIANRRKPKLDAANADLITAAVKESSDKYHARRDLELIQWQSWIFERVRPWGRDVQLKFDKQSDQVHELALVLGRDIERIHLDPFPSIPPPLPE